jgi:ParB family chromosome partitioning protein
VEELQRALGTKVKIVGKRKRGRIEIEFYSPDELDRIIDLLRRGGA